MAMDLKRAETHLRRSRIRAEGAAVKISNKFRAQAIVDAYGKRIRGVELLARKWLQFYEIESMLRADIDAVNAASILLRTNAYETVHVNAEPTSMIRSEWMEAMAFGAKEGLVIEVVERNTILMSNLIMSQMTSVVDLVRHCGGLIALDDATFTNQTILIVEKLRPEIIKVERPEYIGSFKAFSDATFVVERVETLQQADMARSAGADCLQGYLCDIEYECAVPVALTPPGVVARSQAQTTDLCLEGITDQGPSDVLLPEASSNGSSKAMTA